MAKAPATPNRPACNRSRCEVLAYLDLIRVTYGSIRGFDSIILITLSTAYDMKQFTEIAAAVEKRGESPFALP